MDHPMTKEESYADRRLLFKNIWDTAINIVTNVEEKKEPNVIHKPKIIKTLRLDEVNRRIVGKKKKQRIKNLRVVCNKLLDICDRQDADDMFYEQVAMNGRLTPIRKEEHRMSRKLKGRKVRKAKKAKNMFAPTQDVLQIGITSPDRSLCLMSSGNSSPIKSNETSLSIQENFSKREKRNKVQKVYGFKAVIPACHKYSNKRLFPINKIDIT